MIFVELQAVDIPSRIVRELPAGCQFVLASRYTFTYSEGTYLKRAIIGEETIYPHV